MSDGKYRVGVYNDMIRRSKRNELSRCANKEEKTSLAWAGSGAEPRVASSHYGKEETPPQPRKRACAHISAPSPTPHAAPRLETRAFRDQRRGEARERRAHMAGTRGVSLLFIYDEGGP